MLHISMLSEESFDSEDRIAIYRDVIREVYGVSKLYKRKSKKSRNSSIQAPTIKMKRKKEVIVVNQSEQGYASDRSEEFEEEEESSVQNVQKAAVEQEETDLKSKLAKKGKEDVVVKDE